MSRPAPTIDQNLSFAAPQGASWNIALLGLASGTVLIPLNSTMIAIALPKIMTEFQVSASTVSWLATLYLATVALVMPASGTLGDRFGHRKMFVLGVTGFGVTSLVAAITWSFPVLVAARALQAISGASVTTNAASILRSIAPSNRRGTSFGLLDMISSTSAAVGPFIGGLLISGLGWRSIFAVAIPMAVIAAIAVRTVVPPTPLWGARGRIDVSGLVLLSASLLVLLLSFSAAKNTRSAWLGAGVSAIFLIVFVRRELRIPGPAIDVRLFRIGGFSTAVAAVFGATIVLHATLIFVPILTQQLLQASAFASGVALLCLSGLSALTAPLGGRLSDQVGRRTPAVVGSVLMVVGLGALWVWTDNASTPLVGALLGIIGVGFGLSGSARHTSALESVPLTSTGMAAGVYYAGRYIGGAVGAGLAGVMLGTVASPALVAKGFGVLAVVAVAVALVSLGLRGRPDAKRFDAVPSPAQLG